MHVILPLTIPKPLFLADLAYYGIENVDASKIVYHFGAASPCLADIEEELSTKMVNNLACINILYSIVGKVSQE